MTKGDDSSLVRSLPAWVKSFDIVAREGGYLMWYECGPQPTDAFPSQMILDIPDGRYEVDVFDTMTRTWVSRESAGGGPLVAGLSFTGNPLIVWIRPQIAYPRARS